MFRVTIQPRPITVLVDTLNADLAEEMARQYLTRHLDNDLIAWEGNRLEELFYADKSDAKVEKSNEPSFGAIYKVV